MAQSDAQDGQPAGAADQETGGISLSSAHSLAALYQGSAQSIGLSMQNAVAQQQHMNAIATAVTSQCVSMILGQTAGAVPPPSPGAADIAAVLRDLRDLTALLKGAGGS